MARVMGQIDEEHYKKLSTLLPYGSQEVVLGMVMEDWISYCIQHPGASLRYIERELLLPDTERVLASRTLLLDLVVFLTEVGTSEAGILTSRVREELKDAAR